MVLIDLSNRYSSRDLMFMVLWLLEAEPCLSTNLSMKRAFCHLSHVFTQCLTPESLLGSVRTLSLLVCRFFIEQKHSLCIEKLW